MEVKEALALIEKIIEEHRQITRRLQTLQQVANDVSAMRGLDKAQEDFVPGRLNEQKQALQSWQESLAIIDRGIRTHFDREETALLIAVKEYGDEKQVSAWHAWLTEHEELRNRLTKLKEDTTELAAGNLSRELWEGKAWGVRSYQAHTRKSFELHARGEQKLLRTLRNRLQRELKEGEVHI
ncbi:MAG: hypothetical protein ACE5LA_00970 [Dehalococcoidales bacterium]